MSNIITDDRNIYLDANSSIQTIENLLTDKCKKPYGTINLYLNETTTDILEYEMFGQLLQFLTRPELIISDKYDLDLFDGNIQHQISLSDAAKYIFNRLH